MDRRLLGRSVVQIGAVPAGRVARHNFMTATELAPIIEKYLADPLTP